MNKKEQLPTTIVYLISTAYQKTNLEYIAIKSLWATPFYQHNAVA